MRKKMLAALLAVSMVASMTACGSSKSESTDGAKEASDLKIGLITDVGGVNDGSFNQSSWEGLESRRRAWRNCKLSGVRY